MSTSSSRTKGPPVESPRSGAEPAYCVREVDGDYHIDYHNAPRRQLVVNLTGSVEIETGTGDRRVLGPGTILLAEDRTGQGHISRSVGGEPRTCLFVPLDEGRGGLTEET